MGLLMAKSLSIIALCAVLAACQPYGRDRLGTGCCLSRQARRHPAALELPRVGTAGDLPPADQSTVITVDALGVIAVGKAPVDPPSLRRELRRVSQAGRVGDGAATRYVILRVDKAAEWRAVADVLRVCSMPGVELNRIVFAVSPEDGSEDGGLALYMPRDLTYRKDAWGREIQVHETLVVGREQTGASASLYFAAYANVKQASPECTHVAVLVMGQEVTCAHFLACVDVLLRAGIEYVVMHPPIQGKPGESTGMGIRYREKWLSSHSCPTPLPDVRRRAGELVGVLTPPEEVYARVLEFLKDRAMRDAAVDGDE